MANVIIPVTLTRPNNTTAYPSNGVGLANATSGAAAMQIPGWALSAGGVAYLSGIVCNTNLSTVQWTLRVHFWKAAPNTVVNDGAVFPIIAADDANYQNWVDLPGFSTRGAGSTMASTALDATQVMKGLQSDGSNVLWAQPEIVNAFNTPATPAALQTLKFQFLSAQ